MTPEEYRLEKYQQYSKSTTIQPMLEVIATLELRILSCVITEIKIRSLVGLKRDNFEELLRTNGVSFMNFCHGSFAKWNIQQPNEQDTVRLSLKIILTKFYLLQLKYPGSRKTKATIFNISIDLPDEAFTSYLSLYGEIKALKPLWGAKNEDYSFILLHRKEKFLSSEHADFSHLPQERIPQSGPGHDETPDSPDDEQTSNFYCSKRGGVNQGSEKMEKRKLHWGHIKLSQQDREPWKREKRGGERQYKIYQQRTILRPLLTLIAKNQMLGSDEKWSDEKWKPLLTPTAKLRSK